MFPFKFELKDAIHDYLYKEFKNANSVKQSTAQYLFASYLCFLDYKNKEEIFNVVRKNKKEYYLINIQKEQLDYLKSLPTEIYTHEMYEKAELSLLKKLNVEIEGKFDQKHFHDYLISYVSKSPQLKEGVLPWIKDYNNFYYFASIISSRGYLIPLSDYETLKNMFIMDTPAGARQKQMFSEILKG